jgi:hypothetical protein
MLKLQSKGIVKPFLLLSFLFSKGRVYRDNEMLEVKDIYNIDPVKMTIDLNHSLAESRRFSMC